MRVAIIGGGASGLFAGGLLAKANIDTCIFDGNEKLGKKLYITGKGRCNLTNDCPVESYLENVVNGKKFMQSAINKFNCQDTMKYFEALGCPLKVERGGRVFPVSDKSSDVIKALTKSVTSCDIHLNEKVKTIINQDNTFKIVTDLNSYTFDKVIVASGGKSYQATGSKGDGYNFAKSFSLNVVPPRSALCPIKLKDDFCKELQGLSLKNVKLCAKTESKSYEFFGEMLFTGDGISGPIALSLSSFLNEERSVELYIDFKPALSREQLEERLKRDISSNLNKEASFLIKSLLPKSLIEPFLQTCNIDKHKKLNSLTVKERQNIVSNLKHFALSFNGLYPVESGIITAGGVDLKEINPKTMEAKRVPNLYFIGEVLDIDCLTGGYNLQTAFSTAYACANAIIGENF